MSKYEVKLKERKHFIYFNGKKTKFQVSTLGKIYDTETNTEVPQEPYIYTDYRYVYLCDRKVKLHKGFLVHRLVAKSFINNPKKKKTVNHKDGNKRNNCLYNLEWMTHAENNQHALENGLRNQNGELNGNAKYTDEQVEMVCKLLQEGNFSNKKIAKLTGLSKEMVSMIKIGKVRCPQSDKYNWKTIKFSEMHGENHPQATIDEKTVRKICEMLQSGKYKRKEIQVLLNLKTVFVIDNIKARKTWTEISKDYKW